MLHVTKKEFCGQCSGVFHHLFFFFFLNELPPRLVQSVIPSSPSSPITTRKPGQIRLTVAED